MAKVICAVLRYTEEQKSLIIEHEKFRQSVRNDSIDWGKLHGVFSLSLSAMVEIVEMSRFRQIFDFFNFYLLIKKNTNNHHWLVDKRRRWLVVRTIDDEEEEEEN